MSTYGPNVVPTGIPGVSLGTTGHIHINGTMVGTQMQSTMAAGSTYGTHILGTLGSPKLTSIVTFVNPFGKEIVRIEADGTVVWQDGYNIDDAAEALGKAIYLTLEQKAAITERTKRDMRDIVFQEIIALANETGSVTAEELTRYWEAAKIMDKLKGAE